MVLSQQSRPQVAIHCEKARNAPSESQYSQPKRVRRSLFPLPSFSGRLGSGRTTLDFDVSNELWLDHNVICNLASQAVIAGLNLDIATDLRLCRRPLIDESELLHHGAVLERLRRTVDGDGVIVGFALERGGGCRSGDGKGGEKNESGTHSRTFVMGL